MIIEEGLSVKVGQVFSELKKPTTPPSVRWVKVLCIFAVALCRFIPTVYTVDVTV